MKLTKSTLFPNWNDIQQTTGEMLARLRQTLAETKGKGDTEDEQERF